MINLPEQTDFLSVGEGVLLLLCIIARVAAAAAADDDDVLDSERLARPRSARSRGGDGEGCCAVVARSTWTPT